MIHIYGDFHAVDKEPHHTAQKLLLEDILKNSEGDPVIFSGDFWDKPTLHWEKSFQEMLDRLLQFKEVHLIAGNHEIKGTKGSMLAPLKGKWPNLHIYTEPEETMIDGCSFLMLPYLYNVPEMIETYSNLKWKGDYVVSHVSPIGKNFGSEEVEFKNIKAKHFFYGHIHIASDEKNHHIIGVPNTTRQGEQHFEKRYFQVDKDSVTSHPVPVFYDIGEIDFESTESFEANPLWEYNIVNAPSVKEAMRKFKGINVHNVSVIQNIVKQNLDTAKVSSDSILDDFELFLADEKVSEKVADVCKSFLVGVK